ncbi:class III lanthionine synthetase LanKC [Thermostaphylospora chromogena]|uniref:Lanthionine synthetase C-like protein n=1 Tax=Thermostaphylospora chromogena TaxID=35622 RepID=A0A1H1AAH4_9ACTN|nr:class III lanthionine synthetase LanKC [Thermostaphylospora chromogena]SDQ36541.1 Lanthionine synthetase C-like protein [Thermostaphylospora chromogena]
MKLQYIEYCFADRLFYDESSKWASEQQNYRQATTPPPEGWITNRKGPWFNYACISVRIPAQGWKIHVSARLETAQQVLDIVSEYCLKNKINFKFLIGEAAFIGRNLKYADRGGSGKFITIYPTSDEQLRQILDDLDPALHGLGGAYILSDLRWKDGPLYLRYGGFIERMTRNELGEPAMAIENPDGELEVDRRDPVFYVPEWVTPPAWLVPHLEERRNNEAPADFPYEIESALHFSNGGGLYVAVEKATGRKVVLKEARPGAGLDQKGRDAVSRLRREYEFLTKLADLDAVVDCYDYFQLWEHHFLVQELVDGVTLNKRMVHRTPMIKPDPSEEEIAEFTAWAVDITSQVDEVIGRLHERGIAFGDLHPNNIMITEDGKVKLLDFELATYAHEEQRIGMGAPGFVPPDRRDALSADRYALGCLKLAPFVPLTVLFTLDTTRAKALVEFVEQRFPVPDGWGRRVLELLDLGPSDWAGTPEQMKRSSELIAGSDWQAIEDSIARAVWASATPDREDRLFPGDVEQFHVGGLGFGYGAAGVLYAMAKAGYGRREEHEAWLLQRLRDHRGLHRVGLYDGLHGIAYAFEEIGNRDAALEVLDIIDETGTPQLADELMTGASGVALTQLYFATKLNDQGRRDVAIKQAEQIADRLLNDPPKPVDESGRHRRAGLLYGTSGPALLFVRLYEDTKDPSYLDVAEHALRLDLDCCAESEDALLVNEGWRLMPYIGIGSAGIGLALAELLRHRRTDELTTTLDRLRRAAHAEFHICPMVFYGTAGQMGFLHHLRAHYPDDPSLDTLIAVKRERLKLHMVGLRGEIAFPGDQLMRLSMDFGTGSAGILHVLAALRDPSLELLPFLRPFAGS